MSRLTSLASRLSWATAILLASNRLGFTEARVAASNAGQSSWSKHGFPFPLGLNQCPKPLDEDTAIGKGDWSPWSLPPRCIDPAYATDSSEYCVYTSTTFRGNSSLSVITTPDLAAAMADSLDDTMFIPHLTAENRENPPWAIKKQGGRGLGATATRQIQKWEVIMVDFPVIIARTDHTDTDILSEDEQQELKDAALNRLPEEKRNAILSLAHTAGGEQLLDILRTNSYSIDINGVPHMGLFPISSRLNHHCKPNAFWRYSPKTMAQEIIAFRTIEPGEEITHSYAPLGLPRLDRQNVLRYWGFNCTCSMCMSPSSMTSDMRRMRMFEIYERLLETDALTARELKGLLKEMLILIRTEDLVPQLCEYYLHFARAYMAIGEFGEAREHAALAEEYWIRYGTEEHDNVEGMREFWEELERTRLLKEMGPMNRDYYEHDEL